MRRFALIIAISAALVACGQPNSAGSSEASAAQGGEAQADYIARCTREMVAQNPRAGEWAPAQCQQQWEMIAAAGPMAEAILAAVPVSGAADPATLRARLTMVRWDTRPEGTLIASGRMGQALSVQVDRDGPSLNFYWSAAGEPMPYNIVEALRGRGGEVTMIGCYALGMGENNESYRVVATGRAPFALSVYGRMAPTASANSFYNVGVGLSGEVKTLAQLRREDSTWSATCG
jgi:hypothetical protein